MRKELHRQIYQSRKVGIHFKMESIQINFCRLRKLNLTLDSRVEKDAIEIMVLGYNSLAVSLIATENLR